MEVFFGDKAKQGGCICVLIKSEIIQEEIHFFVVLETRANEVVACVW